ncbi:TetR/AcrR family transcriptional regulator [Bacillus horti]|uniref:AcrR family transcriptional regulator n=1 Tax=Caldalkalibacillus horti TaxID=77523 RepID=A0ABT9VWD8_9BACI|nr:TetR/AcrR family transcriptional regulator [Bacillus horti]MDQ0165122.1 AcrR family transcriptional regulator [Bacillus horti]
MREKKQIPSLVKDQKLVQKRREQIIESAVALFIEKGFFKTTTREIAAKAGFSIGTLYEYIEAKEDVLYLVCDAIHHELEERLLQSVKDTRKGIDSLQEAMVYFFQVMNDMQDRVLLIYQEAKSLPKDMLRYVLGKEKDITQIFENILLRGIEDGSIALDRKDTHLMSHNIMVLGEMWVFRRWALGKQFSLEEFIQEQTSLILNQIRKPKEEGKIESTGSVSN